MCFPPKVPAQLYQGVFVNSEEISGHLELVTHGFSFPTSLTFDEAGASYIAEAGLPFGGARPGGRVWKIEQDSQRTLLAQDLRQPVNGLTFYQGSLYLSHAVYPGGSGRISRLDLDGRHTVILDNLPGPGNYHTNMVAFGPDGKLYFSQGAMTNTGYVGLDAYELGWLRLLPHAHDLPGCEIELTGVNLETPDPLSHEAGVRTRTGAFVPFGKNTYPVRPIPAPLPCTP